MILLRSTDQGITLVHNSVFSSYIGCLSHSAQGHAFPEHARPHGERLLAHEKLCKGQDEREDTGREINSAIFKFPKIENSNFLMKWAILGLFFFMFVFSIQLTVN